MTFSPIRRTTAILAAAGLAAAGLLATQASAATINPSTLSASAITATLSKDASIPGTAWAVEPGRTGSSSPPTARSPAPS